MAQSYTVHFQSGFERPVRYRRGEGLNVWGSRLNELAWKLDGMDLPPDAVSVLRELFEEIGQHYRDAVELAR